MRKKHRNDQNHGKDGWVGGNPRYRGKGFQKGDWAAAEAASRREIRPELFRKSDFLPLPAGTIDPIVTFVR